MKRFFITCALLCIALFAMSQNDTPAKQTEPSDIENNVTKTRFNGVSGGMMFHGGYQFGTCNGFVDENKEPAMLRSLTYGLGGALRVSLFHHMHIGGEGYVSTMPVKSQGDGSNVRNGWGGILADYYITLGRFQLLAGATIGGGAQRSIHVISDEKYKLLGDDFKETWENIQKWDKMSGSAPAAYTRINFFALDPFVGAEYALTNRIHLIWKIDWLIAAHSRQYLTPSGPRLYMGLMFGH